MLQSTSDNVIIANVHSVVVSCSYCRLLSYYFRVGTYVTESVAEAASDDGTLQC